MQFKRSLLFLVITIGAVVIALFLSASLDAPKPESNQDSAPTYSDGDSVNLKGELVCLQHREQSEVQTMECAYGFKDESGAYYAVEDATEDYSLISQTAMNEPVQIEGTFRTNQDKKYLQNGTIQLTAITK